MTNTPNPSPDRREAYARVIDPDAAPPWARSDAEAWSYRWEEALAKADQIIAMQAPAVEPVKMILFCPACGAQHIDEPQHNAPSLNDPGSIVWDNPPHRSHLCLGCGHIWRPADVPTEGVRSIATKGKADSPTALPSPAVGGGQEAVEPSWLQQRLIEARKSFDALSPGAQANLRQRFPDLYAHPTPVREPEDVRGAFEAGFQAGLRGNPILTDDDDGDGGQCEEAWASYSAALAQPTPPSRGQEHAVVGEGDEADIAKEAMRTMLRGLTHAEILPADVEEAVRIGLRYAQGTTPVLSDRVAELEAALRPFAVVADALVDSVYGPAWGFNGAVVEHEDFRRARAALPKPPLTGGV